MISPIQPLADRIQVSREQVQVKEKESLSDINETLLYCVVCQTQASNPQPVIEKRKRKYRPL